MARIARVVIPGCPHHIVHRGNRGDPVFLAPEHRTAYRRWLQEYAAEHELRVWAYCLMTNHVHLIVVPERADSLAFAVGYAHRRYAQWLNEKEGWVGHLWAGRYYSVPMDEPHLWTATRYVETNPVRAGLARRAQDYPWSSAASHALNRFDALLAPDRPFPDARAVGNWADWLAQGVGDEALEVIRRSTNTGRPLGSREFVASVEEQIGRCLSPRRRGPKRRQPGDH
jgi:putative transposase